MRWKLRTLLGLLLALGCSGAEDEVRYGVEGGQWRSFAGDPGAARYSPLDQIDADNFAKLEFAWTWVNPDTAWKRKTVAAIEAGSFPYLVPRRVSLVDFQGTPLMVDGVLYGSTAVGQVYAVDAGSGREIWTFDPQSYASSSGGFDFFFPKHRGLAYWRSGDDERIFLAAIDAFLWAIDARTGQPVSSFGERGRVDLLEGVRYEHPIQRIKDYFQSSPPAIHRNTVVVGSSVTDRPKRLQGIPGDIRGFDARSGKRKWTFHTIPEAHEFGAETWENGSWRTGGAANVWGPMSVDPERGRVYATTSTPWNDLYGGHRPGDNLFGETLLCLDAETGERIWHQQLIRHGLWDYDPGAPPNLVDLQVDGRPVKAVAQVTKQAFTFVFDRETGEPVWPIEDRAVPPSDVPGEKASPTQRFPTRPPPFDRQGTFEDDLIDFTPEIRREALAIFRRYRTGPLFTPPSLAGSLILPGSGGGSNWRGAAFDPETEILYVTSITQATALSVKHDPANPLRYVTALTIPPWVPDGNWTPDALPLVKPPYSRITAIDLNRGEIVWQAANGNGPRNHPRLAHLKLPPLGSGVHTCALVTRTLLFAADGAEMWSSTAGEPIFRAYDKQTGRVVGEIRMPARVRGCPMTYLENGVQYLVMPVADADHPPSLVALALP